MMDTPTSHQRSHAEPTLTPSTASKLFAFEQLTRLLLKKSVEFCSVDLFNDKVLNKAPETPANQTGTVAPKGDTIKTRPRWVSIVRGLYFYLTARVVINVCLQYMYDFHWHEYERLRASNGSVRNNADSRTSTSIATTNTNAPGGGGGGGGHLAEVLEKMIERDVGRLKFVGAPLINLHFGVEILYVYLVWAAFVLYFRPQLVFRYVQPFDMGLLRAVVDWDREQLNCDRMVRHEVNKFCTSNKFFVQSQLQWSAARHSSIAGFKFNQLLSNLSHTTRQLNRMAAKGSLRPLNRSYAWIKRTTLSMGLFCSSILAGHVVLVSALSVVLPHIKFFEKDGIETEPMDLVFLFETFIFNAIEIVSINFYLTLTAFNTLDQIRTVNQINRLLEQCIRSNTRIFRRVQADGGERFAASSSSSSSTRPASLMDTMTTSAARPRRMLLPTARECYAQMNNNLLFVVMSYKIFVRQTKTTRSFSAFAMLTTTELMILLPVAGLISAQYLTTTMLYTVVGCCVTFIILGDISMAPCCYFYSRHLRTYRALHNLLAHTVEVRRAAASTVDLYDSHTILILRKELREPDLLLEQFAIKLLGIHFSYRNFLKIHFWCGILAILGYYASFHGTRGGVFAKTFKIF